MIQLLSPSALAVGDVTYNYPARTTAGTQPVVPSPLVVAGVGNVLTFTELGGAFIRMDQEPSVPTAGGWFGTFAPGTRLLYTGNGSDPNWFGPITINFATPVLEFGLLAQFSDEFFLGPFFFTVFNGSATLGTFSQGATGLPSFLGARATGADSITSLVVRGPTTSPTANDFAIGPVTASVPEPTTLALLIASATGMLWRRRNIPKLGR